MRARGFALAIASLAFVAWLASKGTAGETTARGVGASGAPSGAGDLSRRDSEHPFVEGESRDVGSARAPVVPESAAVASWSSSRATPNANVGHLVVRGVDAATNEPLHSIGVRCVSETRLADELAQAASEIDLALSAGTYSILVSARGYESIELPEARVKAGETLRLPPARLRAGDGRIEVDVFGVPPGGRGLFVELIGTGRNPCGRCGESRGAGADGSDRVARAWQRSDACPSCGFARDRSRLSLAYGAYAEFAGLASGSYALRVTDNRGFSCCEPRSLVLRAGGVGRVAFDLSSPRTVRLECVDVNGRSLAEEMRQRLAEPAKAEAEGFVEIVPISLSFSDATGACVATAGLFPPAPRNAAWIAHSAGVGRAVRATRTPFVDRARLPGEELRPPPTPPDFGIPKVACDVELDGLARVGPLPSSALALRAPAGRVDFDRGSEG